MKPFINLRKEVLAATVLLAVVVGISRPARAQLAVSDALTELNTGHTVTDLNNVISRLWTIQGYDYHVAASLTVGQGGGFYVPAQTNLIDWNNTIFSEINDQNFALEFPGWQQRHEGENAAETEKTLVTNTLLTYQKQMQVAREQGAELTSEDFSGLSAKNDASIYALTAIQVTNGLLLQLIKEMQYQRQLTIADIMIRGTEASQQLNDQARASADALAHGW